MKVNRSNEKAGWRMGAALVALILWLAHPAFAPAAIVLPLAPEKAAVGAVIQRAGHEPFADQIRDRIDDRWH